MTPAIIAQDSANTAEGQDAPPAIETAQQGTEAAQASASAEQVTQDPVKGAEGLKEAVASEGSTIGSVVETLDSYSVDIGSTHVSLWSALVVVMVLLGMMLLARMGSKFAHWVLGKMTRLDQTQRLLSEKILTIIVWGIAFLIGIDLLGIDLTALAVFSGAFGLAIGFGLQKTFGNLIAGIILLMDRSIKPGDTIGINDGISNTVGQIRKIGLRAVSVVTRDQKEYLIPNENLMINQVENWSYSSREVRVKVPVGVSYNSDMVLAEKLMRQAAEETPRVLKNPKPNILMMAYGESSVDFEIRIWITDPEDGLSNVRSEVLKRLWVLFKENGIEIPFPQRDLNLRDNKAFQDLVEALKDRDQG